MAATANAVTSFDFSDSGFPEFDPDPENEAFFNTEADSSTL
jgi:hypothetical protein